MFKRLMRAAAKRAGYLIINAESFEKRKAWPNQVFDHLIAAREENKKRILSAEEFSLFCARHSNESTGQLFQDLFVLFILNSKRNGYFVEFGATDGICLSNTYSLERAFDWTGILAEPAKSWHAILRKNRSAKINYDCVWRDSGQVVKFRETAWREFSTISSFARNDSHASERDAVDEYEVSTISLEDLFISNDAPRDIDFMSIDTEGSEFEILQRFDFSRYHIKIITVEHNFTENRAALYRLLTGKGYRRLFEEFSGWDDWYVLNSTLAQEFGMSSPKVN